MFLLSLVVTWAVAEWYELFDLSRNLFVLGFQAVQGPTALLPNGFPVGEFVVHSRPLSPKFLIHSYKKFKKDWYIFIVEFCLRLNQATHNLTFEVPEGT